MNGINPVVLLAAVAGTALLAFAMMVKSSQSAARDAGAAEAKVEDAKEDAKVEEVLDERIQTADIIVAAQRDPASGVERLQDGTL